MESNNHATPLARPSALRLSFGSPSTASGSVNSPMTDLSMNLGGLSTSTDTPKRRLSLSSDNEGTPTPLRLPKLFQHADTGLMDSPANFASPSFQEPRSLFKSSALSRFRSMPVPPFCGYDASPSTHKKLTVSPPPPSEDTSFTIFAEENEGEESSPYKLSFSLGGSPPREQPKFGEDEDTNSQDSGFGIERESTEKHMMTEHRFAAPVTRPPRKNRALGDLTNSPLGLISIRKSPIKSPRRQISDPTGCSPSIVRKLQEFSPVKLMRSSLTSSPAQDEGDDGFLDCIEIEDKNKSPVPSGMTSLLNAPILANMGRETTSPDDEENKENQPLKCNRGLFRSPSAPRLLRDKAKSFCTGARSYSYKRSEPCREGENTPVMSKRRKSIKDTDCEDVKVTKQVTFQLEDKSQGLYEEDPTDPSPLRKLQRSHSDTETIRMAAPLLAEPNCNLVGDSSRSYALPTIKGEKADLKSITPETLVDAIKGEYCDKVASVTIIDCRYPYEYEGGHIKNAMNLYTKDAIIEEFLSNPAKMAKYRSEEDTDRHHILVFHCEFSSERAPKLSRFLRNSDRNLNMHQYPKLNYPEIYLLHGGYKNLFQTQKDVCEPQTYKPMKHKDHQHDLRHFRAKSKSWAGERSGRPSLRGFKLL